MTSGKTPATPSGDPLADAPRITVASVFGRKARLGLVALRVVGGEEVLMQPDTARKLAFLIMDVAEQAEAETVLVDFLLQKLKLDDTAARAGLAEYRRHRETLRGAVHTFDTHSHDAPIP